MLGCRGIHQIPAVPVPRCGRPSLPPSTLPVNGGGRGPKWAPGRMPHRVTLRSLTVRCKEEALQTEQEVRPRRKRRTKREIEAEKEAELSSPSGAKEMKSQKKSVADGLPASKMDDDSRGDAGDEVKDRILQPASVKIPVGNREIMIETGLMGRLANGAVTITDGETVLYCTACSALDPTDPSDFLPLTVSYQERFSAAGRTSGGFIKREGRTRDHEILVCRLIDRPIRPLIAKGFNFETQILTWVLSYDGIHSPEPLAITAAGAALALSDIPLSKSVAGVRVGLVDGQFLVNPTVEEMAMSKLDMVIAGTAEAVLMIEGYCDFLSEEMLLEAVDIGQSAIAGICTEIDKFANAFGKSVKLEGRQLPPPALGAYIEDLVSDELEKALQIKTKKARGQAIGVVEKKLLRLLSKDGAGQEEVTVKVEDRLEELVWNEEEDGVLMLEDGEVDEGDIHVRPPPKKRFSERFDPIDVKLALKEVSSNIMRRFIVKTGRRSDGRGVTDLRPIDASCGLLPRVHGSALFTRGETQALAVATLGGGDMAQRVDNLTSVEPTKKFYLQYAFPHSSVGETGRVGAPSRREIGHGTLAERALEPILPTLKEFPYTIRLETIITESNGSSSMASVCGGCLAMLDAGVPLRGTVAGVAMGLILDTNGLGGDGEPLILTDILGSEDALGDMDFKIAGSEVGVTAFQMDIKVEGITIPVMRRALMQAKEGRVRILGKDFLPLEGIIFDGDPDDRPEETFKIFGEMEKSNPPPTGALSQHAPLIDMMQIRPEKINLVIGSGGKTIKGIIEECGVLTIDITDNGNVTICGRTPDGIQMAKAKIEGLSMVPVVGTVYRNCPVKGLLSFGCFVEIAPGKEGLIHISELDTSRVNKVEDIVKMGDLLDVKLIEINMKGQLRLSRKQVLIAERPQTTEGKHGGQPKDPSYNESQLQASDSKQSRQGREELAKAT